MTAGLGRTGGSRRASCGRTDASGIHDTPGHRHNLRSLSKPGAIPRDDPAGSVCPWPGHRADGTAARSDAADLGAGVAWGGPAARAARGRARPRAVDVRPAVVRRIRDLPRGGRSSAGPSRPGGRHACRLARMEEVFTRAGHFPRAAQCGKCPARWKPAIRMRRGRVCLRSVRRPFPTPATAPPLGAPGRSSACRMAAIPVWRWGTSRRIARSPPVSDSPWSRAHMQHHTALGEVATTRTPTEAAFPARRPVSLRPNAHSTV